MALRPRRLSVAAFLIEFSLGGSLLGVHHALAVHAASALLFSAVAKKLLS